MKNNKKPIPKKQPALLRLTKFGIKQPLWFYSTIAISLVLALVSSFRPVLISNAIDKDIILNKSYVALWHSILLIISTLIAEIILQYILVLCSNYLAQNVIKDIRTKLYDKLLSFSSSFFDRTPNGVLVTRSVSDIETISTIFTDGILMMFGDLLRIFAILGFMYYLNWELATISFLILPLMLFVTRIFQKTIKVAFTNERAQTAIQNSFVQERLSGMTLVKVFNQQKKEYNKFFKINQNLEKAYLKTVFYFSLFFPVVEIIVGIAVGVLIYYAAYKSFLHYDVSPGTVIAFISAYIPMLVRPMRQIADRFNTIQRGIAGSERVFDLLDSDFSLPDEGKIEKKSIKGNITFENVCFSYIPNEPVLKDINLEVKSGEKIAFVGATGAGKSTIINLLSRFYDISSGNIFVDGIEVKEYKLNNLRSHISVVLQDVFLFSDTVYENIVMGDTSLSYEQVRKAAKEIQIDDFIMSLPGGYQYVLNERGSSVSLGQRQLISFLRAYLYNPSILVLDEATSSIDTQSEELIQQATEKITENRTSIIVAHRLSTIKNADKIVVLDKGKIVEIGNHNELIAKEQGFYKKLYNAQFSTLEK